jgi:hypothetical protein
VGPHLYLALSDWINHLKIIYFITWKVYVRLAHISISIPGYVYIFAIQNDGNWLSWYLVPKLVESELFITIYGKD